MKNIFFITCATVVLAASANANVTVKGDKYFVDQFGAEKKCSTQEVTLKDATPKVLQSNLPSVKH